jgi:O-antigen ligase
MASSRSLTSPKKTNSTAKILYLLLALITLSIYTNAQDPINPIKQCILLLFSAWLLPKIWYKSKIKYTFNIFNYKVNLFRILFVFLFFQLISALISSDITTGILGDHQRRNGFLTYFSLSIILIYTSLNFNENLFASFGKFIIAISLILGLYGLLQSMGKDFVDWNNPYNNLILTVGNPNFASSLLAILGILLTSIALDKSFRNLYRATSTMIVILFICLMVVSNSIQGLVVYGVGVSSLLGFYLYKKYGINYLVITYAAILLVFIGLAIFGTLQKGPFKFFLYKESVSIRGFYWRAAIEMFKANPIFGVGTDQYGTFFRLYRESEYPLRYGFEITSSNAHNVYLQFLATGGILVGVSYIVLIALIFKCSVQNLKSSRSDESPNMIYAGIFFAWIGYVIQGIISIDNISLGIWGWFLGGALLSRSLQKVEPNNLPKKSELSFLLSSLFVFLTFIFSTFIFRSEIDMQNQMRISNIEDTPENRKYFVSATNKVYLNPIAPTFYKRIVSERLFDGSEQILALERINELIEKNSFICENYYSRITINQNLGNVAAVIKDQEKLLELDPWGAGNMYNLGLNYMKIGNFEKMEQIKSRILNFASQSQIGYMARSTLVKP